MEAHDRELLQKEYRGKWSRPKGESWPCELCQRPASVYCPWDEANLCDLCDAKVHGANFLVARHSRHVLCPCCGAPALHSPLTGPRIEAHGLLEVCPQCTSRTSACPKDVEALSSAESCCIDADEQDDRTSSSVSSSHSPSPSPPPPPAAQRLSRVVKGIKPCSSEMTVLNPPEEGLGDSEDCSYGILSFPHFSSPARKRRRIPPSCLPHPMNMNLVFKVAGGFLLGKLPLLEARKLLVKIEDELELDAIP